MKPIEANKAIFNLGDVVVHPELGTAVVIRINTDGFETFTGGRFNTPVTRSYYINTSFVLADVPNRPIGF